ncbi:MAG: FtsW/RodA/SpoVE family cell cycle protein [Prevotellaceae bacterium]|nr:FtsW/RodA/SpoVE family cell cycle protein [Prevotellaceae bacterium]
MAKVYNLFKGDKVIWMVFFFLCMISIVEVYSASSELTYKSGSFTAPILKHVGMLIGGLAIIIVTLNIPCRFFKILTPILLPFSFFTLLYVIAVGEATNGAQRWMSILGVQFQPSEIAKGTVILAVAQILSFMQTDNGADKRAFTWILCVAGLFAVLIGLENLSTAALLLVVVYLMMIIGRIPAYLIGRLTAVCVIGVLMIVGLVMWLGEDNDTTSDPKNVATEQVETQTAKASSSSSGGLFHRFGTWKNRIKNFTSDKEVDPSTFDWDKDGQKGHANIAIATSGIIGKGPGNSVERDWLPQAFSDFIYAIIIEEMGIIGAAAVVFLFIVLLFRVGHIANNCERNFPAFLILGLALMLTTQAMFNMCVAVGIAPVTGQPLPLISKGGTSTLINCAYIGVILSVSRSARKKEVTEN